MCKAFDVADFFISPGNAESEDPMTNMRISKLMYFAQGWHLQRFGKPLYHALYHLVAIMLLKIFKSDTQSYLT